MKNKFLILIMLVTAISFVAVHKVSAQTTATQLKGMTPPQRADFQTQLMKTKLNLDARQIVQVKAINLKYAYKFQPILTSDDGSLHNTKVLKATCKNRRWPKRAIKRPKNSKKRYKSDQKWLKNHCF
jgi:hypothetical protein